MHESIKIKVLREAGQVMRGHAKQLHREYSVGIHTYNMLGLLEVLHPDPSLRLYRAILWHDVPERFTGDIPTPVKKLVPEIKEGLKTLEQKMLKELGGEVPLSGDEGCWLKAIDMLELWLWCREEMAMGNKAVDDMYRECTSILDALDLPEPALNFLHRQRCSVHTFLSDIPGKVFDEIQ